MIKNLMERMDTVLGIYNNRGTGEYVEIFSYFIFYKRPTPYRVRTIYYVIYYPSGRVDTPSDMAQKVQISSVMNRCGGDLVVKISDI